MKKQEISSKFSSKFHCRTWTMGILIVSITLFSSGVADEVQYLNDTCKDFKW